MDAKTKFDLCEMFRLPSLDEFYRMVIGCSIDHSVTIRAEQEEVVPMPE